MTIHSLFPASGLMLVLAAGIAGDGARSAAPAADLSVRGHVRSSAAPASDAHAGVPASNARAAVPAGSAPARLPVVTRPAATPLAAADPVATRPAATDDAAASYARAARARFNEARNALERGLLLSEAAQKADVVVLEAAMKDVHHNLALLAAMAQPPATDAISKTMSLAQEWYQAGLKILNPPPEGVTELPLPMSLKSKADSVAAALDQLAEQTIVHAPPRSTGSVQKRASVAPRSVATASRPAASGSRPAAGGTAPIYPYVPNGLPE